MNEDARVFALDQEMHCATCRCELQALQLTTGRAVFRKDQTRCQACCLTEVPKGVPVAADESVAKDEEYERLKAAVQILKDTVGALHQETNSLRKQVDEYKQAARQVPELKEKVTTLETQAAT